MIIFSESPEYRGGENKLTLEQAAELLEENTMARLMSEESFDLEHEVYSVLSEMSPTRYSLFGRTYSSQPVMAPGRAHRKSVWIREDIDEQGNLACVVLTPHFDTLPWEGYGDSDMPEFINGNKHDLALFVLDLVCENRIRQST